MNFDDGRLLGFSTSPVSKTVGIPPSIVVPFWEARALTRPSPGAVEQTVIQD